MQLFKTCHLNKQPFEHVVYILKERFLKGLMHFQKATGLTGIQQAVVKVKYLVNILIVQVFL